MGNDAAVAGAVDVTATILGASAVAVGTIKQWRSLNVSEGLCGQEALPWVAFKAGRKIHTQGGDSELIEV